MVAPLLCGEHDWYIFSLSGGVGGSAQAVVATITNNPSRGDCNNIGYSFNIRYI